MLFKPCIKLLEVVLCQLVQWDFAQIRHDVQADAALIARFCGGTEFGLGVVFKPVFQPVPEWHFGP